MAEILVVEDSSVDRTLIGSLLARHPDWQLKYANDGQEAINILDVPADHHGLPDVILTDLQMPRVDGLELVSWIRDHHPQIPVVLVTSFGSEKIAVEALRAGATTYSPKSLLKTDLVRTVRQVMQMSQRMKYTHDTHFIPAPKQVAFVLENDSLLIGPTIEHLQNNLPSWSDKDRLQFGMAMDEALTNAMHHGNLEVDSSLREVEDEQMYYELIRKRRDISPFCHRRVRIEAEFSDQHICVQISDDGLGFNPKSIPDPTSDENLHKLSGRGLFLIRAFMDSVAHNLMGNQITMTKLRKVEA
ncbi:MAG: response regulator [Planctomycetota bacterium]